MAESPIDVNRSLLAADPDDDEDDEVEETSKCPRAEDAETDL